MYILYVYHIVYYTHTYIYRCVYVLYICIYACTCTHTFHGFCLDILTNTATWLWQLPAIYLYICVYALQICTYVCEYIVYVLYLYVGSVQLGTQPLVFSVSHISVTTAQEGRWCCTPQRRCLRARDVQQSTQGHIGLRGEGWAWSPAAHTLLWVILTSNADRKGPDLKEEM